ncbi:hypothetical protein [Streptomyces atratus]|uniref:hypothetical protein n=1 Tax=Streptomyces atratus TaxID=1893 RepID=UPI0037B2FC67
MSGNNPVDPVGIPVFTGDLALLDTKVTALSGSGAKIATAAGDVHTSFGGLSAFYKAPEAEQLFATTKPVADTGLDLSSDLCVIAGALGTYSDDAYPLVEKLKELKREAVAFRVKVDGDDEWREDGDLVEENNHRRNEIAEVWAAFQEVERACHAKIVALVGGKALKTNDGSTKEGMYGYDAEALKQAESLPWGTPVEESTPWWQVWEHAYDFGKGFVVDGVWGTIKGLGTLFGVDGWDAAKQAWTGLAKLATGLSPAANIALWVIPDDKHPSWILDSRKAVKETAKALVAWDQWGNNPSRAAGAVTFNALTTVFTGGTGGAVSGAGKAGMVAKTLSFVGKTGRIVDPMTYVFKGAGAGLTKIRDVMAGLKGMGRVEFPPLPDNIITLPEGAVRLPDGTINLPQGATIPDGAVTLPNGTVKLPDGAVALPEGTVKSPFDEGAPYMDRDGNLYNEDGSIAQHANQSAKDPRTETSTAVREPAPVGAAVHLGDSRGNIGRVGDDLNGPTAHVGDHLPGGHADDLGHSPSASHETPTGGHREGQGTGGHGDGQADGHGDGPSGGHSDGPGGGDGQGAGGRGVPDDPEGWERPSDESGPFRRGDETEQQIRSQLRGTDVKPGDVEAILKNLSEHPAGKELADTIASGRFKNATGFSTTVSNISQYDDISGALEQIRLANRLHEAGLTDISFEVKQAGNEIKPGVFTGERTDLDLMARDANGDVHGWQFKDMTGADSTTRPNKVVDKIFKKITQLTDSHADVQTFVVDTKVSKSEMATQIGRLQKGYEGKDVQFVIRTPDGTIFVPRGGKFTPEEIL